MRENLDEEIEGAVVFVCVWAGFTLFCVGVWALIIWAMM
jgi:hypothetical protein